MWSSISSTYSYCSCYRHLSFPLLLLLLFLLLLFVARRSGRRFHAIAIGPILILLRYRPYTTVRSPTAQRRSEKKYALGRTRLSCGHGSSVTLCHVKSRQVTSSHAKTRQATLHRVKSHQVTSNQVTWLLQKKEDQITQPHFYKFVG